MSNMMCNSCHKVGEPYKVPSCGKPECPANGFARAIAPLTDQREVAFNELREAADRAGVAPTALDWFKAGTHYANRASGVQGTSGDGNG